MSVRESTPDCLRPGGLTLTELGILQCGFHEGATLADIGCGNGITVEYLLRKGYMAYGVDLHAKSPYIRGDAGQLPFDNESMDGLLYECSFSKMQHTDQVLAEARRVLSKKGKLLLSDFYARGVSADFQGLLGRVESADEIQQRFRAAGFRLTYWTDASQDVLQTFGQLILNHGCIETILGANREQMKAAKCGYFLSIWEVEHVLGN